MDLIGVLPAVALVVAVVLGALAQGVTGIGFTLVAAPVCALVLDPSMVVGTIARVALIVDLLLVFHGRRLVDLASVRNYLGPALLAVPVAIVVTSSVPDSVLVSAVAVVTLAGAYALLRAERGAPGLGAPHGVAPQIVAGFASGFMGVTTGMSGPPVAIESARRLVAPAQSRATLALLFAVVDSAAVAVNRSAAGAGLTVLLGLAAGSGLLTARRCARHLSGARVREALAAVIAASALAVLARQLA